MKMIEKITRWLYDHSDLKKEIDLQIQSSKLLIETNNEVALFLHKQHEELRIKLEEISKKKIQDGIGYALQRHGIENFVRYLNVNDVCETLKSNVNDLYMSIPYIPNFILEYLIKSKMLDTPIKDRKKDKLELLEIMKWIIEKEGDLK